MDAYLLTFEELRGNSIRHLQEVTSICVGSFTNPDADFLLEEYSAIATKLRCKGINYDPVDLRNAYWSSVFQLEYKQNIYPNCMIWECKHKCKILRFRHEYPVNVDIQVFGKSGNPLRGKYSSRLRGPVTFHEEWEQLSLFEIQK